MLIAPDRKTCSLFTTMLIILSVKKKKTTGSVTENCFDVNGYVIQMN